MNKMNEARKAALLQKKITWRGTVMTKQDWLERLHSQGATLHEERFPKYLFNRTKFNRLENHEQAAYEKKLETKMPYAVQLPDGVYYEVTKTEAEYFEYLLKGNAQ